MKPYMLLIACSHRLHESHDANIWAMKLARWHMEQMPDAVIVASAITVADLRVADIAMEQKHRLVVFHADGEYREYDGNGKAVSKKTWHGRSVDRAMVRALTKAKSAGWDVSALVRDHDRSQPDKEGDGDLVDIERLLVSANISGNCFAFDMKNQAQGIGGA